MFFELKIEEKRELPNQVYVRADTAFSEDGRVWLEAVDAIWFDGNSKKNVGFGQVAESALSIVEARLSPQAWNAMRADARWLALDLGNKPHDMGVTVKHYGNLFADGKLRSLKNVQGVYGPTANELDKTVDTSSIQDADPADIAELLDINDRIIDPSVAVYDVGQGNCNALLARNVPCIYFDIGGGVLDHALTFPATLKNFCFSYGPAIVLSHWDWDHWSSAYRDPKAFDVKWIAPRQNFGNIHAACASRIGSNLMFWPNAHRIGNNNIWIEKCQSRGKNRNHTGLAFIVEFDGNRIILPGDARYSSFPSGKPGSPDVLSLVAPHHGADMRSAHVPCSTARPESRVAISCGDPNRYDHPRWNTIERHGLANWQQFLRTDNRRSNQPAHIRLEFPGHSKQPSGLVPCGENMCQLSTRQS
ncbi:ComEC/Rec2 family competence protein [Nitrospirillum pindoramense]|uniref:Beta-lactamase superfamily II metal-dependent hydrolase n=1 Tax=Nitrospirillum amazonense TaxID=28077 RepID=A0A560HAH0_9PROT|nr:hypothetical protein [Nitrospirillum amazonense]TWB42614.1 beta-lactamase superfamily II metal-dependent hydrolase [Nitrospirillum amazonense]